MGDFDERSCLAFDPFAGDFEGGGDSDRVLSDKIVTCRKARPCHICCEPTKPGTRIRTRSEVYDGEMMSFAWCATCCAAMAGDDDAAIDARYAIGNAERKEKERADG